MFQKDMNVSLLLDFYGDTLSERRRELMEMYYNEDLSLSEIAEIAGISRQGVRDSVKKSEKDLFELEETLGLVKRFKEIGSQISDIVAQISTIADNCKDDGTRESLNSVVRDLEMIDL